MAIKKELIGINGEKKEYFKIKKVVLDYENNFFAIDCIVYTNGKYREQAKEKIQEVQMDEAIWHLIQNKEEKTSTEHMVLSKINYGKIIKAHREAEELILKEEQIRINIGDKDIRDIFYTMLKNTSELNGAIDVLEQSNKPTSVEIEEELQKRLQEAEEQIKLNEVIQTEIVQDPEGGL